MGCGVYWSQIKEIERALSTLPKYNILETSDAFKQLTSIRSKLLAQVGFKFPRTVTQLAKLVGLSPGIITLWHDIESGWMSEARVKPGAPPVYRAVTDDIAMAILKGELTKELEAELMKPDEYLGE